MNTKSASHFSLSHFSASIAWLVVFLSAGAAISVFRGQDANWDLLNYHYYNAWAFAHSRYGIDHFASLIQSYFYPALDFPYFFLVSSLGRWPKVVSAVMGMQYGLVLYLLYLISAILVSQLVGFSRWQKQTLILICVCFAAGGSALWSQAGTTTNEVSLAVFVLFATLVFLRGVMKSVSCPISAGRSLIIGALLGTAAGLKLTAVTYVPALGLAILLSTPSLKGRVRAIVAFSIGVGFAFTLSYLPWGVHLYRETGNPFFPAFNNVFHSPLWVEYDGRDTRFLPKSAVEWAMYPLKWALFRSGAVIEYPIRDPRIAFLYLVIVHGIVARIIRIRRAQTEKAQRADRTFFFGVLIATSSYVIWLALFSILRYAIPVESLICILLPVSVAKVCEYLDFRLKSTAVIGTGLFVTVSTLFTVQPAAQRVPYADRVFSINAPTLPPDSLVVLADVPMGFIAPLLHEKQPTTNFVGTPWYMYECKDCGISKAIQSSIRSKRGPLYVAYYIHTPPAFIWLSWSGVRINYGRCQVITTNVSPEIKICEADSNGIQTDVPTKFRFTATVVASEGTQLRVQPPHQCAPVSALDGDASIDWTVPGQKVADLLVSDPPSGVWDRVAVATGTGTASIQNWLHAGLVFKLQDVSGETLATARIGYESCN